MGKRHTPLVVIALWLSTMLGQCTAQESQSVSVTPVVVIKEVIPHVTPTPTPFCTELPPGKRVEIEIIPPDRIHIVLDGFRKEDDPHILLDGIGKVHGQYRVVASSEIWDMQIGEDAHYELTISLPSAHEPVEWWELKVTFPGGAYCRRLTFPWPRRGPP